MNSNPPWDKHTVETLPSSFPSYYLFVPLSLGILFLTILLLLYVSSLAICPFIVRTKSQAIRTWLFPRSSSGISPSIHPITESFLQYAQRTYRIYGLRLHIYGQQKYTSLRLWLGTRNGFSFPSSSSSSSSSSPFSLKNTDPLVDTVPLFMVVNPKSGGGIGTKVQSLCQESLPSSYGGPMEVIPLTVNGLTETLRKLVHLSNNVTFEPPTNNHPSNSSPSLPKLYPRLICAGGDGTVSAIVRTMMEKRIYPLSIPLIILPLGTGNDIANSLRMNQIQPQFNPTALQRWFNQVRHAPVKMIDVWSVSFGTFPEGSIHILKNGIETALPEKEVRGTSILYTSIGIDAQLVWNVEKNRQKKRWLNKLLYFIIGSTLSLFGWFLDSLTPSVGYRYFPRILQKLRSIRGQSIGSYISSLTVDNIPLAIDRLPASLYSILAVSSYSYGGGTNLWPHTWSLSRERYQQMYRCDGNNLQSNAPEWLQRATVVNTTNGAPSNSGSFVVTFLLSIFSYLFFYPWWRSLPFYPPNQQPTVQATASPYASLMNRLLFALNRYEPWVKQSMNDQRFELLGSKSLFHISGIIGTKTGILGGIYRLGQPRTMMMEFQRPPSNAHPPVLYIPSDETQRATTDTDNHVGKRSVSGIRRPSYTTLSIQPASTLAQQSTLRKTLTTPYRVLRSMGSSLKEKARNLRTKSSSLRKPRTIMVAEPELMEEDEHDHHHHDKNGFEEDGNGAMLSSGMDEGSSSSSCASGSETEETNMEKRYEKQPKTKANGTTGVFFPEYSDEEENVVSVDSNPIIIKKEYTGDESGLPTTVPTIVSSSVITLSPPQYHPDRPLRSLQRKHYSRHDHLHGVRSNRHRSTSSSSSSSSRSSQSPVRHHPGNTAVPAHPHHRYHHHPHPKQAKGYATLHRSQLPRHDETDTKTSQRKEKKDDETLTTLPPSTVVPNTNDPSLVASKKPLTTSVTAIRIPEESFTSSVTDTVSPSPHASPYPYPPPSTPSTPFSPPITYPSNYVPKRKDESTMSLNEGVRARHSHYPYSQPQQQRTIMELAEPVVTSPLSALPLGGKQDSLEVPASPTIVSIGDVPVPSLPLPAPTTIGTDNPVPMSCIYIQVDGEAYRIYGLRYIQISYAGQTAMVHMGSEDE